MFASVRAKTIVAALLCFLAETALAADTRVALVIGNANYPHTTAYKNAANDATLVASTLRAIGFTEVLEHHNLDVAAFNAVLERFAALVVTSDWALVYYAGDAVQIGGANYLIPTDVRLESAEQLVRQGIGLERLLGNRGPPRQLCILILDAPRTDPFPGKAPPPAHKGQVPEGEVLIAFATAPGQPRAVSQGDNGPFALSLARHIAVPGRDVEGVFKQVQSDVTQATNGLQNPWMLSALKRLHFIELAPPR
jgi:uncharacterized caspase-like protein